MYQEARKLLKEGRNIFITGAAGTGKSHLLNLLKKTYGGELVLTASTGIAALNIGGMTLHSYAGLGRAVGAIEHIKAQQGAGAGGRHKRLHKDLGKTILDPITSIKKVTAETYCVTVPQYGRFVQNGLDGFNSQGMTLQKVMVDISASFAPGMVYVALSRTPTSDGLHVKGLSDSIFLADPQVIEFYKKMEAGYGK